MPRHCLKDHSRQSLTGSKKCHATLNDLEQATEQLYECSLEAEAQHDERKAKAEADCVWLLFEQQPAQKQRQEQAKVTGIMTSLTNDSKYLLWHRQSQCKTPGPNVPQPYATPKETGAAGCDTRLNQELGSEDVYDPLASRNASPYTGTGNTTHLWRGHHYHTTHLSTNFGRIWRLRCWRPRQWCGLTSYQV